ncbi:hypothetical protein DPMN_132840 [Dreissena polymorpha]|uniref:Uncharacterized protein n=1 Tax=Dreissena polymorpha TaxID=45954 RepID=A0A9D4FWQ4_DREPO|nr:hypothetical protein DPMN_132840 [Dreissena polymorpha]
MATHISTGPVPTRKLEKGDNSWGSKPDMGDNSWSSEMERYRRKLGKTKGSLIQDSAVQSKDSHNGTAGEGLIKFNVNLLGLLRLKLLI